MGQPHEQVRQLGRRKVAVVQALYGRQLHHIKPGHLAPGHAALKNIMGLAPADAAGGRRARGWHERCVKGVHIKGDVDALRKILGQGHLGQAHTRHKMGIIVRNIVRLAHFGLFAAKVAHAKLHQRQTKIRHGAVHNAGMGIGAALIGRAQVGMGIKLHNAKRLAAALRLFGQSAQRAQSNSMLTPKQHGQSRTRNGPGRGSLDALKHFCNRATAIYRRRGIKTCLAGGVSAFPGLKLLRSLKQGRRAAGRARAVRNALLKRNGNDMKTRLFGLNRAVF